MKIDAELFVDSVSDVASIAKKAEDFGFDGLWANETKHDPFLQLAMASANTRHLTLGTSIALAFTRSPTTLAYTAWDLQALTGGRLILGLGSQVKGHIERRFGLKWESPAPKMREVIQVLRAVWRTWQEGEPLDFRGRFYRVNLMTPFFSPPRISSPDIPIYLAGVNPAMCRLAGELCDGLHVHPLHTPKYLREVVTGNLERGLMKGGRSREKVRVTASVFVATGKEKGEIDEMKEECKLQMAFYASTRTYRPVMDLHGWGAVAERLHEKSVRGDWAGMASEITDEMLEEFVVQGKWGEIAEKIVDRYRGLIDRVRLYHPFDGSERWRAFVASFRG